MLTEGIRIARPARSESEDRTYCAGYGKTAAKSVVTGHF